MAKKKTSSKKKAAKKATKKKAAKKSTRKSAKKSSGKKTARKSAKKSAKKSAAGKSSARKSSGKPRKTAARKAREAGKVKKNAGLTSKQLKKFRDLLLSKRATLLGDVTSMTNEALGKNRQDASGDLSNMPIHMADIGSDNYEQEFTLGLLESERQMLRDIDHAIERMAEGTYGICLGTGEPIAKLRLEAKPWAKYSIEYARLVERGQAPEISGDEDGEPDEDSDDDWDEDDE